MAFLIPAKTKHTIRKDKFLWAYNLLEIAMNITSIPLKIKLELAKENIDDSMDIFNSELVTICEEYLKETTVSLTQDNKVVDLSARRLAHLVALLAFSAFEKSSEWDKAPFKVEIDMPNAQLKKFESENRKDIKELERLQKMVKKPVTNEQILEAIKKIKIETVVVEWGTENVAIKKKNVAVKKPKEEEYIMQEGDVKGAWRVDMDF